MRVAGFDRYDLHNTPGSEAPAFTLWFAGCSHHCHGCQNQELWDKNVGEEYEPSELASLMLDQTRKSNINTVVLLGGEPLEQNFDDLIELCSILRNADYNIWLYTGYDREYVKDNFHDILHYVEYVKYGKYDESLLQPEGTFPISSNQKLYRYKYYDNCWLQEYEVHI